MAFQTQKECFTAARGRRRRKEKNSVHSLRSHVTGGLDLKDISNLDGANLTDQSKYIHRRTIITVQEAKTRYIATLVAETEPLSRGKRSRHAQSNDKSVATCTNAVSARAHVYFFLDECANASTHSNVKSDKRGGSLTGGLRSFIHSTPLRKTWQQISHHA